MIKSDRRTRPSHEKRVYIWSRSIRDKVQMVPRICLRLGGWEFMVGTCAAARTWKSSCAIPTKKRRSRPFINLLPEKRRRYARAFYWKRVRFGGGAQKRCAPRAREYSGPVLHEGRMYARKIKACRSTGPVRPSRLSTPFLHKLSLAAQLRAELASFKSSRL